MPACVAQENMVYDLNVGRYIAENMTQERPETDWLAGREGRIDKKPLQPGRTAPRRRSLNTTIPEEARS
jgi:hypothetical protein